jgi:hypothetical protein
MGVDVTGLRELREDIAEAAARADDVAPVLASWAADAEALVDRAFASQTSPDGVAWAPRKTTTRSRSGGRERPRTRTPGRSVGVLTGAMRASVAAEVMGNALVLEVAARHARFFVEGTRYQPARPLLPTHASGPAATALDELADALADHVVEPLRG